MSRRSWYRRKRYDVPIGIVVTLAVVGAFGEDPTSPPVGPSSEARAVVTETVTVTATPSPPHVESEHRDETTRTSSAGADPEPTARESAEPTVVVAERRPARTYRVARVIDGDTLELSTGDHVRVVGVDTPERGECGYDSATAGLERLVLGRRVRLGLSDEDHDRYGRLLRYVDVGTTDAGLRQIRSGLAIARYDSRDGYGEHPREGRYIAADSRSPSRFSCRPEAAPQAQPQQRQPGPKAQPKQATGKGGSCASGYDPCLPIVDDLDCADVDGAVQVTGADPYGLDREDDGVGCES